MSDMDQIIREDARLIVLKALRDQTDEQLNSAVLLEIIETFGGIRKTREWLHGELDWLAEMGAVRLTIAGTVRIASIAFDRLEDRCTSAWSEARNAMPGQARIWAQSGPDFK